MQKPSREAQKSFTWDATVGPAIHVDANPGPTRKYKHNKMVAKKTHKSLIAFSLVYPILFVDRAVMSHDTALKLLGLSGGQNKTKAGVRAYLSYSYPFCSS